MYTVGSRDVVVELSDLPASSAGAPCPQMLADEGSVLLAYYLQKDSDWANSVQVVGDLSLGDAVMVVTFSDVCAHMFGPPNDEAFAGHPLASRGLGPYGNYEVQNSSWIRSLERMNRVHEHHDWRYFDGLKHYIFSFHDSTFEVVAKAFTFYISYGAISDAFRDRLPIFRV